MKSGQLRSLRRVTMLACYGGLVGVPSAYAAGEPNPFSTPAAPDVTAVAPANTFINDVPRQALPLGKTITLSVKASTWQEAESVKQVRLFRLGQSSDTPTRYGFFGDCDVFLTTVLAVRPVEDRGLYALQFSGLPRPFLEINSSRTRMTDARWMAVFETTPKEPGDVFRIRASYEPRYFEGGWIFTLAADKDSYTPTEIAAAAGGQALSDELIKELDIHNNSRPCHIVTMKRVANGEERRELIACVEADTQESVIR